MRVEREVYKSPKDLPHDEYLTGGSPLCAGCGGLTTLRLMHKMLGGNVVIVNAAGCMTLLATYLFTPLRSSWLYTTMASASARAQGIRDALDVLLAKGRIPPDENLEVFVLAGDGSTFDMGLSSVRGARSSPAVRSRRLQPILDRNARQGVPMAAEPSSGKPVVR